jgi:hypothetical protein
MKLSEAGHTSNIDYWKAVAKRYQSQRDMALQKVQFLQERMLAGDRQSVRRQRLVTTGRCHRSASQQSHPQFFTQVRRTFYGFVSRM